MKQAPIIKLDKVSFTYDNAEAESLRDFSLEINRGECVLLCGQSGCGKTTITRLINGLVPHFYEGTLNGNVHVRGLEVKSAELAEVYRGSWKCFPKPQKPVLLR